MFYRKGIFIISGDLRLSSSRAACVDYLSLVNYIKDVKSEGHDLWNTFQVCLQLLLIDDRRKQSSWVECTIFSGLSKRRICKNFRQKPSDYNRGNKEWTEKAMATHSSTLAWKIPWTEEPGRLQSMVSLLVGHD